MAWYNNILGAFSTPNSTAANSSVSGAATANQGSTSSLGGFISGLADLGTKGVQAYSTVASAGKSSPAANSTATASAGSTTMSKYLPWILIGGGVLLIVGLFHRDG